MEKGITVSLITNFLHHEERNPATMNCTMRAIFFVFLFSLTLGGWYILGLNQAAADGLPIVDIKAWAYDAELTLPANQITLQVTAYQADQGLNPLTYR